MVFRGCWGRVSRQLSGLLRLLASAICEKGGWKQPSVLQEMKWSQHHSSGTWMQYQLHRPEWWEHEPALARQGQTGGWSRECCLSPAHLPGHQPGSLASGEQPKPPAWERHPASAGIKLHCAHRWWACLHLTIVCDLQILQSKLYCLSSDFSVFCIRLLCFPLWSFWPLILFCRWIVFIDIFWKQLNQQRKIRFSQVTTDSNSSLLC